MLKKTSPPSTKISDLVVKLEFEQSKKNTVLATSSGVASRFIGIASNFFPTSLVELYHFCFSTF